jgi:hypothetical protein
MGHETCAGEQSYPDWSVVTGGCWCLTGFGGFERCGGEGRERSWADLLLVLRTKEPELKRTRTWRVVQSKNS